MTDQATISEDSTAIKPGDRIVVVRGKYRGKSGTVLSTLGESIAVGLSNGIDKLTLKRRSMIVIRPIPERSDGDGGDATE